MKEKFVIKVCEELEHRGVSKDIIPFIISDRFLKTVKNSPISQLYEHMEETVCELLLMAATK